MFEIVEIAPFWVSHQIVSATEHLVLFSLILIFHHIWSLLYLLVDYRRKIFLSIFLCDITNLLKTWKRPKIKPKGPLGLGYTP